MLPQENFGKMEPNPAILCILAVKTEWLQHGPLTKSTQKLKKIKFRSVERTLWPRGRGLPNPPWVRAWPDKTPKPLNLWDTSTRKPILKAFFCSFKCFYTLKTAGINYFIFLTYLESCWLLGLPSPTLNQTPCLPQRMDHLFLVKVAIRWRKLGQNICLLLYLLKRKTPHL